MNAKDKQDLELVHYRLDELDKMKGCGQRQNKIHSLDKTLKNGEEL